VLFKLFSSFELVRCWRTDLRARPVRVRVRVRFLQNCRNSGWQNTYRWTGEWWMGCGWQKQAVL